MYAMQAILCTLVQIRILISSGSIWSSTYHHRLSSSLVVRTRLITITAPTVLHISPSNAMCNFINDVAIKICAARILEWYIDMREMSISDQSMHILYWCCVHQQHPSSRFLRFCKTLTKIRIILRGGLVFFFFFSLSECFALIPRPEARLLPRGSPSVEKDS